MDERTTATTAARRFFWIWLIAATGASILGNVAHALLNPAAGTPAIAALAAVVPPVVLLCATHGVHVLMQSRITGAAYRVALSITAALAVCAFVLSFDALRSLAITAAGLSAQIAWLWPLAIDLSITACTVALVALTDAQHGARLGAPRHPDDAAGPAPGHGAVHVSVRNDVHTAAIGAPTERPSVADLISRETVTETLDERWAVQLPAAEQIIAAGVTRIDRVKVAQVLAEHAAGAAPSMIARNVNVGYSTVGRILDHQREDAAR